MLALSSIGVCLQETREGRALPDRAPLHRPPTHVSRQVPAHAQGPQQADDWRVPRQPAERVQSASARVRDVTETCLLSDNSLLWCGCDVSVVAVAGVFPRRLRCRVSRLTKR